MVSVAQSSENETSVPSGTTLMPLLMTMLSSPPTLSVECHTSSASASMASTSACVTAAVGSNFPPTSWNQPRSTATCALSRALSSTSAQSL